MEAVPRGYIALFVRPAEVADAVVVVVEPDLRVGFHHPPAAAARRAVHVGLLTLPFGLVGAVVGRRALAHPGFAPVAVPLPLHPVAAALAPAHDHGVSRVGGTRARRRTRARPCPARAAGQGPCAKCPTPWDACPVAR